MYDWNFKIFEGYGPALWRGVLVTLELTFYSSLIGTLLGVFLGAFLRFRPLKYLTTSVNDIFRAIPLLVLIYLFYYFPYQDVLNTDQHPSEFTCSLLALTLAQTVFTADVVRAAIDGVSEKIILGGKAVGFKSIQIWYYLIIPDITRQILPTLIAFYIGNLKLSSLASVISTPELLYVAKTASGNSFRSLEAWVLVAVIYILLVLPLSTLSRLLEKSPWLKRRS